MIEKNVHNILKEKYITAIVLAGGKGSRMNSDVAKQYMLVHNRPILYYALQAFETCEYVNQIILVCRAGEESYCLDDIVRPFGFKKVTSIVAGGQERYLSVMNGLKAAGVKPCDYVMIHDGARPCVNTAVIQRALECVLENDACVSAMPVKDTIKVADQTGFAVNTPDRSLLWQIQTPQTFSYKLISQAYEKLKESGFSKVTDDAMVVEMFSDTKVKLVQGDYTNIKVTTPEDLVLAEAFIRG